MAGFGKVPHLIQISNGYGYERGVMRLHYILPKEFIRVYEIR
jgi:hypothetical protein